MSEYYRHRLRQLQKLLEPGLRRMLLISFVLHLIVPLLLSGVLKSTHKTPKVPVYRVNLVNKPVKDPRAGRPDASPTKKKKTVKKKTVAKQIPLKAKKVPVKTKQTVKTKPVVKKTAPVKSAKPDKVAESSLQKRLAEMQAEVGRKAQLDRLRAALAAQQADLGKPDLQAPVGEPDGKGEEAGISSSRTVEGVITKEWRLSQYQLPNLDLQAEVKVIYSAEGKMRTWEWVEKSGNAQFDDSLYRAIQKSRDLGVPLPAPGTFEIIFNLKDLQNR